MKYALTCVNGELKYNLTKKELMGQLIRETKRMEDDVILIVYPMVVGSKILIEHDILAVHLLNGELDVYGVKDAVFSALYINMSYSDYYNAISELLDEFEKNKPIKESRAFEQEQFEQAEAAKENADYRVYIGFNKFKFIGRDADDLVYKVLEGLFSSISKDSGDIVIKNNNTGSFYVIAYNKAYYNCSIKIGDGDTMSFEYYKPEKRRELMSYIRKEVIL